MFNKRFFLVVLVAVALSILGTYVIDHYIFTAHTNSEGPIPSPLDATYTIDGTAIVLKAGTSEIPVAPHSAEVLTTKYFGNEAAGDLSGDGIADIAFIVTQTGGGSGTFFYLVAGIKGDSEYIGTDAILLGDRIAPQSTEIVNGEIIVNYADRREGDAMTVDPSVGITKYVVVKNGSLTEVKR